MNWKRIIEAESGKRASSWEGTVQLVPLHWSALLRTSVNWREYHGLARVLWVQSGELYSNIRKSFIFQLCQIRFAYWIQLYISSLRGRNLVTYTRFSTTQRETDATAVGASQLERSVSSSKTINYCPNLQTTNLHATGHRKDGYQTAFLNYQGGSSRCIQRGRNQEPIR